MTHPDDYVQSTTPFYGDQTGEVFALKEEAQPELESYDRSFETQSGFLVLVKPVGNRYSLSFKRQLGTPPTSSIFLTADEAVRLANILGPNASEYGHIQRDATQTEQNIFKIRRNRSRVSLFNFPTILFIVTVVLFVVTAMIIYNFALIK